MVDGFDFDFMIADYDNDILTITRNNKEYEYILSVEKGLWDGGVANGVDRREIGKPEDMEDYEDTLQAMDKDEYSEEVWGDEYEGKHFGGRAIRKSRW